MPPIHLGRSTAMTVLAAIESFFELPDLETMETEGNA
jgi:hypothetical protein